MSNPEKPEKPANLFDSKPNHADGEEEGGGDPNAGDPGTGVPDAGVPVAGAGDPGIPEPESDPIPLPVANDPPPPTDPDPVAATEGDGGPFKGASADGTVPVEDIALEKVAELAAEIDATAAEILHAAEEAFTSTTIFAVPKDFGKEFIHPDKPDGA